MSLASLEARLSALQSEKAKSEAKRAEEIVKRDKAKKRRDSVKPIGNKLKSSFDNNCSDINRVADWMKFDVLAGIKGVSSSSEISSLLGADKEIEPEMEMNLSTAISAVEQEYEALDTYYDERVEEIRKLTNRIDDLRWQIIQVKAEIAAEKARIEAEKARRKAEALAEEFTENVKNIIG